MRDKIVELLEKLGYESTGTKKRRWITNEDHCEITVDEMDSGLRIAAYFPRYVGAYFRVHINSYETTIVASFFPKWCPYNQEDVDLLIDDICKNAEWRDIAFTDLFNGGKVLATRFLTSEVTNEQIPGFIERFQNLPAYKKMVSDAQFLDEDDITWWKDYEARRSGSNH